VPARLRGGVEGRNLALAIRVELGRAREVEGDHLGELSVALAGPGGDAGGGAHVEVDALRPRERRVGDVADQLVVEAVEAGLVAGAVLDQGPALERAEQLGGLGLEQLAQRLGAKSVAEHGRVLDRALLLARERVEAGGDRSLDGVGQP
jgi:hypothetical protein